MRLMMRIRIARLKQRAACAYRLFMEEGQHADCGDALLKEWNVRAAVAAREYNFIMSELSKLDPDCPQWEPL